MRLRFGSFHFSDDFSPRRRRPDRRVQGIVTVGGLLAAGLVGWLGSTLGADTAAVVGSRSVQVLSTVTEPAVVASAPAAEAPVAQIQAPSAVIAADDESAGAVAAVDGQPALAAAADGADGEGEVTVKVKWAGDQDLILEVVTGLFVDTDETVHSGDVVVEVSGRPIFVFDGQVPATRNLSNGDRGVDVAQLESALSALGYHPGQHDGVFDGQLSAAIGSLYADRGYALPAPDPDDVEDVEKAQAEIDELEVERQKLAAELSAATAWGVRDSSSIKQAQAELAIEEIDSRLRLAHTDRETLGFFAAEMRALLSQLQFELSTGEIDNDPEEVSSAVADQFTRLAGDKPRDYVRIDGMIGKLADELREVETDLRTLDNDIERRLIDREAALLDLEEIQVESYGDNDVSDAELITFEIDEVWIKIEQAQRERDRAAAKLATSLSIDEFIFVPGLPGVVSEVKAELRDEADGTLLEITTGASPKDEDSDKDDEDSDKDDDSADESADEESAADEDSVDEDS